MNDIDPPYAPPKPTPAGDEPFPCIAGYRFQKRLGTGGMATVYLATQESLDRPVSIKVMARETLLDETSKQRFENEARTIAKLDHTGIVGIHEVGRTDDGRMYYIMPYLAHGDLSQRHLLNDEDRIVDVLRTLLSALGYAHAHGIVHRDVKGENVLFDAHDRPYLTDFGIATSKRDTSRLTSAGHSVGSSGFMAPEQARGEAVDGRADLYSVGVLTFVLLTGDLPFRSTDPLAMALMHAQDAVPRLPPSKRHWQSFVDRAMAKSPAQRFDNAALMLQALDKVGRGRDNSWIGRSRRVFYRGVRAIEARGGKRLVALVALASLMLLIAAGYAAYAAFTAPNATPAPDQAPPTQPAAPADQASPPASPPAAAPATPPATAPSAPAPAPATTKPAPPPEQKPAAKRAKPTTAKPPAPPPPKPVKKKRSWLSRLFHRH